MRRNKITHSCMKSTAVPLLGDLSFCCKSKATQLDHLLYSHLFHHIPSNSGRVLSRVECGLFSTLQSPNPSHTIHKHR
ncbi:hypothetical protein Ancab_022940 [Ancistrocladus abbreviatus]